MRRSSKRNKALPLYVLLVASICFGRGEARPFPPLSKKLSPRTPLVRAVEKSFGLYLTHPELREESEGTYQSGSTLTLTYLDDFESRRVVGARVCAFARWLLLGRLEKSAGAQPFFVQNPEIREVQLIIYRLRSILSLGQGGRYQQRRRPTVLLSMRLSRRRSRLLRPGELNETLTGLRCLPLAESLLDELWIAPQVRAKTTSGSASP